MPNRSTNLLAGNGNGHAIAPNRRQSSELAPDTLEQLARRLKKQSKCYRKQLRKCQRRFSQDAVHDLRIEARRLLSLLDLLAPFTPAARLTKAQRRLKCHLDIFDELRDTQVQLATVRKMHERFDAARKFQRCLQRCQKRLCRQTHKKAKRLEYKQLRKFLKSSYRGIKDWLKQAGPAQANPALLRVVSAAFDRTLELRASIKPDDPRAIHCTRIAFKKFRYMLEPLAGRLAWANDALLDHMRCYQSLMGDIQDGEVLLRGFKKFSRKEQVDGAAALKFTRELLRRRRQMIQKYLERSDELLGFWPPKPSRPTVKAKPPTRSRRGSTAFPTKPKAL